MLNKHKVKREKRRRELAGEKLIEQIQRNPSNIAACMRQVAKETKTNFNTLLNMYYKKRTGIRDSQTLFLIHTPYGIHMNIKNSKATKEQVKKLEVKANLVPTSTLTAEEKVAFVDILLSNKL